MEQINTKEINASIIFDCPFCDGKIIKKSINFYGCTNYPKCNYKLNLPSGGTIYCNECNTSLKLN